MSAGPPTRPGHAGVSAPRATSHTLWLALGVVVTKWIPPFRRRSARPQGIEWRYVTTRQEHAADPRFLVVACSDFFYENATAANRDKLRMGFQFSCFCKTAEWFRQALQLFPTARFIGKIEDDSIIHDSRVLAELMGAHRLARRERERDGARAHSPWLWYGHFGWAIFHSDGRSKWCGDIDDHLSSPAPASCARQAERAVGGWPLLAPFASGGLDIRSRALAQHAAACDLPRQYISGFDPSNWTYAGSCDGQHGYFVARCLETRTLVPGSWPSEQQPEQPQQEPPQPQQQQQPPPSQQQQPQHRRQSQRSPPHQPRVLTAISTLLHLPWPKFHPPSIRVGARLHTSCLHPHRTCESSHRRKVGTPRECEAPLQRQWRWNLGYALLPLRYRLHATRTNAGVPRLWVEPHNRTVPRVYGLLHRRREDNRYCEELPCGTLEHLDRSPRANVSSCHSMSDCFGGGEGGRYFYSPF